MSETVHSPAARRPGQARPSTGGASNASQGFLSHNYVTHKAFLALQLHQPGNRPCAAAAGF